MTLNATVFDDYIKKIEKIDICSDLQAFASDVMGYLKEQLQWIKDQMSDLSILADLIEAPGANLAKLATWAEKMIEGLVMPGYQAYLKLVQQVADIEAQITRVVAAITQAAERIGSCVVNVATIV